MTKDELEQLESCESSAKVPPERGGTAYSEYELQFINDLRRRIARYPTVELSPRQKLLLKQLSEKS